MCRWLSERRVAVGVLGAVIRVIAVAVRHEALVPNLLFLLGAYYVSGEVVVALRMSAEVTHLKRFVTKANSRLDVTGINYLAEHKYTLFPVVIVYGAVIAYHLWHLFSVNAA